MCFNVLKKNKLRTQAATIKKTIFIFDRNNIHILPPLYIILLIFGSQYVYAEPNVRTEFTLLPLQMLTIFQAYSKMNNPNFLTNFTTYFPLPESRNIENLSIQQSQQLSLSQPQPLSLSQPQPLLLSQPQQLSQKQQPQQVPKQNSRKQKQKQIQSQLKEDNLPRMKTRSQTKNNSKKNIKSQTLDNQRGGIYPYSSRYYPPGYRREPYVANDLIKRDNQYETSKLAFTITIMLELYPGTSITPEELSKLKCNSRLESVRQSWAEFIGKPYIIIPDYKKLQYNKNDKTQKNSIPYQRNNRYTQRNRNYGGSIN